MSRPILSKPPLFTGCVAKLGGTKKKLDCQAHSPPLWLERLRQLSDREREPPRSFSTPQGRTGRRAPDGEHTPGCADGTAVGWDHVEFPGKATDSANDRCSSGERVFFRRRGPATRALLECGCAPTYLPWPWCIAPSGGGTLDPFGS